jgi:hypothetical protein
MLDDAAIRRILSSEPDIVKALTKPLGAAYGPWIEEIDEVGDYIEGLEEDFRQILEYFGKDYAQPKSKASVTMMEYQNGQAVVVLYQLPSLDLSPESKTPNPPKLPSEEV